jgi:hypothetical protein
MVLRGLPPVVESAEVVVVVEVVAVTLLVAPGDPAHVPPGQHPASHPYWIPFSW